MNTGDLRNWTLILALLVGSAGDATAAQNQFIAGPFLGFATDRGGEAIRPILGIPGAAIIGNRLDLGLGFRKAVISPQQNYALALRSEDDRPVIILLDADPPMMRPVTEELVAADEIAISPTGMSAVLYARSSGLVRLVRGLPEAPETIHEFDVTRIAGWPERMAVSDDGTLALLRFAEGSSSELWVADSTGSLWQAAFTSSSSMAFFPQSRDAIVTDDETQYVFLMLSVDGLATRVPLVSQIEGVTGYSAVAASRDARRIFVAGRESESIGVVDVETRTYTVVPCACRPEGLYGLMGTSVFRLNDSDGGLLAVLDASLPEAKIVVVPQLLREGDFGAGVQVPQ